MNLLQAWWQKGMLLLIVALATAGCGSSSSSTTSSTTTDTTSFTLSSTDLPSDQKIGSTFVLGGSGGCGGQNKSPALSWSNPPAGVLSYAISVIDKSFNNSSGKSFVHWIVYNIPTTTTSLARGASASLPTGAINGGNDFGDSTVPNYGGPCPPMGSTHTYEFKVWALNTADLMTDTTITFTSPSSILNGIGAHALASGTANFTRDFTGP